MFAICLPMFAILYYVIWQAIPHIDYFLCKNILPNVCTKFTFC